MTLWPGLAESGHFALIFGVWAALVQSGCSAWGAFRGDDTLMHVGRRAAMIQSLGLGTALIALMGSHLLSDFSVSNVFFNSSTQKPVFYKLIGVWGNHEGSLLLWVVVLSLFGTTLSFSGRNLPSRFKAWALAVQGGIGIGFLVFILVASNPFQRLLPMPAEGRGINPLLLDPALALHPPLLYLGYVGFSMAFSFAVAALIEGRIDASWARWVRPWTLAAWTFLTLGIGLGCWWAYYELGWGGWWFWDPVENASLIPWLCGTALLHVALVAEKRDTLKTWTVLLAILTFGAGLLGTFLVRSGVLTSVHAFAADPMRGVFILALLTIMVGGALVLFAFRAARFRSNGGAFAFISRETGLLLNTLVMTTVAATVLLGTLYPLVSESMGWGRLSVGPPFFEKTAVPLTVPAFLALGLGPLLAWKRSNLKALRSFVPVIIVSGLIVALLWKMTGSLGFALGAGLAVWIVGGIIVDVSGRIQMFRVSLLTSLRRAQSLPRAAWGMTVAHLGVAVFILGAVGSAFGKTERIQNQEIGETVSLGSYQATLQTVQEGHGLNYRFLRATIIVSKNARPVTTLYPEKRFYDVPPFPTSEAAITSSGISDFYAVIGDQIPDRPDVWVTRYYLEPLVPFLWYGILLMAAGGGLSLSDRRVRLGDAYRIRPAAERKQFHA